MKVLKGEYYLSCIKSCMIFTERREGGQSDIGAIYEHASLLSEGANSIIHWIAASKCCLSQTILSMTSSDNSERSENCTAISR